MSRKKVKKCRECGLLYKRSIRRKDIGLCSVCYFWSLVDKTSSPCGCWLWTEQPLHHGYGRFCVVTPSGPKERAAHRVSWVLANGVIPDGLFVLHNCDVHYPPGDITNRRCVNPEHLRLGTQADNARDSVGHGRVVTGDRHWTRAHPERVARGDASGPRLHPDKLIRGTNRCNAKLDDDKVREIRLCKESSIKLAKRFGVTKAVVLSARKGRTWGHVV